MSPCRHLPAVWAGLRGDRSDRAVPTEASARSASERLFQQSGRSDLTVVRLGWLGKKRSEGGYVGHDRVAGEGEGVE
jgi:hypothetical protein